MKPAIDCDIAIVGAGAAGLLSAITAAKTSVFESKNLRIALFDSRQKIGAKIVISGGGRCNITNARVSEKDYHGGPSHFVRHVLKAFTPGQAKDFFESIGVSLKLEEPEGKYFPASNSSRSVLEALLKKIAETNVIFKTGIKITDVQSSPDGGFLMQAVNDTDTHLTISAKRVVLCTGGLSYPETGSDGTGLKIAAKLRHKLVETHAALTPLLTEDEGFRALSGISFAATRLSYYQDNKKQAEYEESFLFTHFGFSGTVSLNISRFYSASLRRNQAKIYANFLPGQNEQSLKKYFLLSQQKNPAKSVKQWMVGEWMLPERFCVLLLDRCKIDIKTTMANLKKEQRAQLFLSLLHLELPVSGVYGYKKAEVTAGGVDLSEVQVATMQSKKISGLYFAGEILDMDGRIGGYNFQWAWSTGSIAGKSVVQSL